MMGAVGADVKYRRRQETLRIHSELRDVCFVVDNNFVFKTRLVVDVVVSLGINRIELKVRDLHCIL